VIPALTPRLGYVAVKCRSKTERQSGVSLTQASVCLLHFTLSIKSLPYDTQEIEENYFAGTSILKDNLETGTKGLALELSSVCISACLLIGIQRRLGRGERGEGEGQGREKEVTYLDVTETGGSCFT
jgi:hypothetical protein